VSFFDEPEETRTPPRTAPRRRRTGGGSRRPPAASRQTIQIRRVVLAVVVLVVIVLIAVLVNSCQVSARNTALKDYNDNVASLNQQSVGNGASFFQALTTGTGAPTTLSRELNQAVSTAASQVRHAKGMNVPDEVKAAQQNFLLALQMRHDGMQNITNDVGAALQPQTSKDAINAIASEMARFYASDVLYKDYTVPLMIGALRAANITVGGLGGQQINSSQFLPDVRWLTPDYVASQLRVNLPVAHPTTVAPGVHGHAMQSVSFNGTVLQPGGSATIPASPPPTFACTFTNDGQNTETNVTVKVTVRGTSVTGQAIVPQTVPGHTYTAQVTLGSSPPKGTYTVSATVERVPGETSVVHNTQTFSLTFQ
jgi:hypothetical protein